MVKTQQGNGKRPKIMFPQTHNYWHSFRGAACNKWNFSHHNLQDGTHLPTCSNLTMYLRNQAQKPQCPDFSSSFNISLSTLHSSPSTACLARSHRAAAQHGSCAQSLGSSLCCSATWKADVLRNHHANEKNLVAGTEYQNEQFLFLHKVCPFLSAFAEVKWTHLTYNHQSEVRRKCNVIRTKLKAVIWSHNPLHPHDLFQLE